MNRPGETSDAGQAGDSADYDVIVIGGGPAGEVAAQYAIQGSSRTAVIIENELLGGECSYWACMPSKALLLPGATRRLAVATPGLSDPGLDAEKVLANRTSFTSGWDDAGQVSWAHGTGIEVLRGAGSIAGPRQVRVGEQILTARCAVVLATGSVPMIPDIPGLRAARPWTNRDVTALAAVPSRVAILGGGVVACEAATWLNDLGAEVIMLVRDDHLLSAAEPFAGERVAAALTERGVRIAFGTQLADVDRELVPEAEIAVGQSSGVPARLRLSTGESLEVDEIVVATGRKPASEWLGLAELGIDRLEVDDQLMVRGIDGGWLYAVGDAAGRSPLTHMGKYQARICGDVIAARAQGRPITGTQFAARSDHDAVPQVVFTDPEVAWVGPTLSQARASGAGVTPIEMDLAVAGTSLARSDFSGRGCLLVEPETQRLLGATFVGPGVAELLHAATVAVVGGLNLDTLWHAVAAYPTMSEVWLPLLERARSELRG